ncbi:MAG TPA: CHAT domain-containing protein [Blastocatellia bacterium]|nr:CHAT domain-containing protein [Blastocatellia bacterium]
MQNVSSDLANGLMAAESADAFFREQVGRIDWQAIASIKTEIDRLAGCDLNQATALADRLAQLTRLIGDPVSHAFAEAGRARVLDIVGRHAEANELYDRAATTMQSSGLKVESAIVRKQQLHALIQLGRYRNALRTAGTARRVLSQADPVQLAQLEANIGSIYYRLDRYRKALTHYDRAREALSERGDSTMLAVIDFSRSSIFAEMDQPDRALDLLQRAAAQFDAAGRFLQAEQSRFHIAYLQFLRGNYNEALAGYHHVRDRVSELGSDELAAYCSLGIAQALLALNAFDDAAETSEAARQTFEKLKMPFELARSCLVSGLTAIGLTQFDTARDRLTRARRAFDECGNAIFTALTDSCLAELAGKTGDYVEMAIRAGSSLRTFSRNRLPTRAAWSRLLMARAAYEMQDWPRASRMARKALSTVEGLLAPGITYLCYHLLGCIQRGRGRQQRALNYFTRSVDAVEQMREWIVADEFKARFLEDKTQIYGDAVAACLDAGENGWIKEAFRLVESSKSRALAELLTRYDRGPAGGADRRERSNSKRTRLLKLTEDLNWYVSQTRLEEEKGKNRSESTLERYRSAALRRERQIRELYSRMESDMLDQAEPIGPAAEADLRKSLRASEILIEFFTTGDELSAFVVSPRDTQVIRSISSMSKVEKLVLPLRSQLEKLTYDPSYVRAHGNHLRETTNHYLNALYREVFAPLENRIAVNQVIVVPHGALHYVPFHALHDGTDYLIERLEVSYAPSAGVLSLCRARRTQQQKAERDGVEFAREMVALGLPDEAAPQIEKEIEMVSAIFPDSVKLIDGDATSANLRHFAPGARFLHISSHGFFRRDNPMFSFLQLADCSLNFYSLVDLRLGSEMVTLSACQTGINALLPGDELHGLMRGFLSAGAPALAVSLWKVADRSTAELMTRMYANIKAGQPKRGALRNAQLAIKSSYDHPYYWAPFVLMGSPD